MAITITPAIIAAIAPAPRLGASTIADALDGRLRRDWALVVQRATALVGTP